MLDRRLFRSHTAPLSCDVPGRRRRAAVRECYNIQKTVFASGAIIKLAGPHKHVDNHNEQVQVREKYGPATECLAYCT